MATAAELRRKYNIPEANPQAGQARILSTLLPVTSAKLNTKSLTPIADSLRAKYNATAPSQVLKRTGEQLAPSKTAFGTFSTPNVLEDVGAAKIVDTAKQKTYNQLPLSYAARQLIDSTPINNVSGYGNQFSQSRTVYEGDKPGRIDIKLQGNEQDTLHLSHEFFNVIFGKEHIDPRAFNQAWSLALKSDEPNAETLRAFDEYLKGPEFANAYKGDMSELQLASERFALTGSRLGLDGLGAIPKDLLPFYQKYIAQPATISQAPPKERSPLGKAVERYLPKQVSDPLLQTGDKLRELIGFDTPTFSDQMVRALNEDPSRSVKELQERAKELDKEEGIRTLSSGKRIAIDPLGTMATVRSVGKGLQLFTPNEVAKLPTLDRKDYIDFILPKTRGLATPKEDEALVIFGGKGQAGQFVDTRPHIALNRGVNENTNVQIIKKSRLSSTGNPARDARGERLLDARPTPIRAEKGRFAGSARPQAFAGGIGGIERDEEGNIQLDPLKAAAGFVGMAGAQRIKIPPRTRGFTTSAKEAVPQAFKIAGQYVPRSTDELSVKAANLIKDDLQTAERLAMEGSDENAVATASELLKHYAKQADQATDEAARVAMYDKAAEIANTIAPKLTELGRSIQAASILGRLTPEGQVRFAAREIQKWNAANPRNKVPELTGTKAREITEEMQAIQAMPEGDEKALRFKKLQDSIHDMIPSKWWEKAVSFWKAGLLTGIKTSGLNIFSNIAHSGTEIAKDIPAAAADTLLSLLTGKRTLTFSTKGMPSGVTEGARKGWRYLRTGYDSRDVAKKLDYKRVNFGTSKAGKAAQAYVDTVFRVLGAQDQVFYYGALRRSFYNQAKAQAKNKGLKGTERADFIENLATNPTDEMSAYAVADAETAVFQNQTALGKAGRGIVNNVPGAEFIMPFVRTPSAVAMQVINYSPVGVVLETTKQIARRQLDQRTLSQAIGRSTVGTVPLYLGMELLDNDMMALDYPSGERERELWNLEGRKPNSIKIGDEWRTVQTFGPAGNLLLTGGHFKQALDETGSHTEAMVKAVFGSIKSFTENTFLRGVKDIMNAIAEPEREAEYWASSFVSSFIPTIINDVARATDPQERRSENVLQRVQSRIPGLRQKLEPQVTALGEDRARVGNPLEVMLDPTRPSPDVSTPVVQELRRLTDEGFPVSPTKVGDKKGYEILTQEQNTRLWERAGSILNQKLTGLFASEKYQNAADDKKAKVVEDFTTKAKVIARAEMVLEVTEGLEGDELRATLSELKADGLLTRDVFTKWKQLR